MNTNPTTPGALTPYAEVAAAAELEAWALEKLEQARFRVPDNFVEIDGVPYLTILGIREMGRALEAHGYHVRAHSLRVLANRHEDRPSAFLPSPSGTHAPTPPARPTVPWYLRD
jgi:hypothetical protein